MASFSLRDFFKGKLMTSEVGQGQSSLCKMLIFSFFSSNEHCHVCNSRCEHEAEYFYFKIGRQQFNNEINLRVAPKSNMAILSTRAKTTA